SQERRNTIFSLLKKSVDDYSPNDVIFFYMTIYEIYRDGPHESHISADNLTQEEVQILMRYLDAATSAFDYGFEACAKSAWLRSILSGIAFFRLELLPILCKRGVCVR
ncbi:hypothetical protein PFISCL1PPCAC_7292, partial [Pristionchus fissidentatus]